MKKLLQTIKEKWVEYILEIMVIIIGILGAFALNNWNESRKENIKEIQMLTELKASLAYDLKSNFTRNIPAIREDIQRCQEVIEHIENDIYIKDSTNFFWLSRYVTFNPKYMAYKSLENKGIDLIQNDSLKNAIVEIYDWEYPTLKNRIEQNDFARLTSFVRPFLREYFYVNKQNKLVPIDIKELYKNHQFKQLIFFIETTRNNRLRQRLRLASKIENVIRQIDEELG